MPKRALFWISVLVLFAAGIFVYQKIPGWMSLFKTGASEYSKSNEFLARVDNYIRQNQLDSAAFYLDRIIAQKNYVTHRTQLLDSAQALRWQIKQIGMLDTGNIYIGVLLNLSDREYEDFLNNKLNKRYLGHPELNRIYLNKLYANNRRGSQISGGSTLSAAGSSRHTSTDAIARRKEYAETIKNSFTELGFDISVEISGVDNARLILTAPEFNDEWFEKFESDSAMVEWHNLGFNQIEIRNNSGYSKTKSW
jgi:hypothetical protein